jgi:hypothetical protein
MTFLGENKCNKYCSNPCYFMFCSLDQLCRQYSSKNFGKIIKIFISVRSRTFLKVGSGQKSSGSATLLITQLLIKRATKILLKLFTLKGQCHEMVCQLRPLLYSLGLNIAPRTCFTLVKSRVKNICLPKQGASRCKMAGI